MRSILIAITLVLAGSLTTMANGPKKMAMNIAVSDNVPGTDVRDKSGIVVDANSIAEKIAGANPNQDDIVELDYDPFLLKANGAPRPLTIEDSNTPNIYDEDVGPQTVLVRKKRCNRDDDDGDANFARSVRAGRRTRRKRNGRRSGRRRRARRANAKSNVTVVTRKIIQNGQVVSQTSSQTALDPNTIQISPAMQQTSQVVTQLPANQVVTQLPANQVVTQLPLNQVVTQDGNVVAQIAPGQTLNIQQGTPLVATAA